MKSKKFYRIDRAGPLMLALMLFGVAWLLVACSGSSQKSQEIAPAKFSVPGGAELLRAVDADSIQATLGWRLEGVTGSVTTQTMTRSGVSQEWESQPFAVIPGGSYNIVITWRAVDVDGVRVVYALQNYTYIGTSSSEVIDLSAQSYNFDRFNDDGDDANNYQELLAGTSATTTNSTVEQNSDLMPVSMTLDSEPNPDLSTVSFTLDSAATVPPANVDGATGEGSFTVDTTTGAISGSVTVSGTSGVPTVAHIHAGAAGEAGDVVLPLTGNDDGTMWTLADDAVLDAVGIAAFEAGELYVNVHTEANPAGELRSQLVHTILARPSTFTISFLNISATMPMTPPVVALHNAPGADNGIRLFEVGQPASAEVVEIAENGNNTPLVEVVTGQVAAGTVSAAGVAYTDPANPGLLLPGASASVTLDFAGVDQVLSVVSMMVCSNDGFSGIDSRPLSADSTETFTAPIYDAGSETNVLALDYWVAECGGPIGNLGDEENGSITLHPGQSDAENADFDFVADAELLEITVTRN